MYKYVNDMLPELFYQMSSKNLDVYQCRTRQYNKLHVPKSNTSAIMKSVSHKGVYLWNLTLGIMFKKELKTFFLGHSLE